MTKPRTPTAIDGRSVRIHESGERDGTVFLLLHGIGLSHRPYRRLAAQLAPFGRVVALELPGFATTPRPDRALSVEQYARIIGRTLDHLDVRDAVTVGHSMGAQFALELARQRPELVSHLVMIGPVVDDRRRTAIEQGRALARNSALEPVITNLIVFADYLRCGPRWYVRELRAMLAYPTLIKIRDLPLPVLTIRGERDPISRASWCRMLLTAAGSGSEVTIPRKRHVVIHTAPVEVARAIITFALRPSSAAR